MSLKAQRIGIIGAMSAEIEMLKTALVDARTHEFGRDLKVYTGHFEGKEIVLCLSGIGKVNASVATAIVIEVFKPDCVINTGSAGGIGKGLKVGDVVIGCEVAHHDVDATAFGYDHGQVPAMPTRYVAQADLVDVAQKAAVHFSDAKIETGLIVSGDAFVHGRDQIARIHQHFSDAKAVEMEAAAIAQACYALEMPFVIIRAISDGADEKADVSFEEFLETAAVHSAQMVQAIIRQL